jgi:hypothetical protein
VERGKNLELVDLNFHHPQAQTTIQRKDVLLLLAARYTILMECLQE